MTERSFAGLLPKTLRSLTELKRNNSNAWFDARPGKGFAIPKEAHNPAFVNWCANFFEGMIPLNAWRMEWLPETTRPPTPPKRRLYPPGQSPSAAVWASSFRR